MSDAILAAVLGATIPGLFAILLWRLDRRKQEPKKRDAWQAKADKLERKLEEANAARVAYLEAQIEDRDRTIAQLHAGRGPQ